MKRIIERIKGIDNNHPGFTPSCPDMSEIRDRDIQNINPSENSGQERTQTPKSGVHSTTTTGSQIPIFSLSKEDFELVVKAVKEVMDPGLMEGRYNREVLYAVVFIAIQNGWSVRQAEAWCEKNLNFLKECGWNSYKAPSKSLIHNLLREIDLSTVLRISAKIRYYRGEVPLLWF